MLDRCLGTFASLDVAGISWEILVVNDGEDPRTTSILRRYKSLLPLVCLETDGGTGKNHALNLAIPEARGAVSRQHDLDVSVAKCVCECPLLGSQDPGSPTFRTSQDSPKQHANQFLANRQASDAVQLYERWIACEI